MGSNTVEYSEKFKERMVARLVGPHAISGNALSQEVDVAPSTLCRWRREASVSAMSSKSKDRGVQRKQKWTAEEKVRLVKEAARVGEEGLGALLRREGLHEADLERFNDELVAGVTAQERQRRGPSPEARRVKELERELRRKEKALAETAALLVLRKKAEAFFLGEEEGDTNERNGR